MKKGKINYIKFHCKIWKKIFYKWASTNAKYCSRECYLIDKPNTLRKSKIIFLCKYCGKKEMLMPHDFKKRKFCSKKCAYKWISENIRGENHKLWKGGYKGKNGYKYIRRNGILNTEHRLIMEKVLNRKLRKLEIVHHIDGNKLNNAISNLLVMNDKEHRIYHAKRR